MHVHTHTRTGIHTLVLYGHKMPKQTSQPGSWLQPLPICVLQIGIWIKWSLRCPEGGKGRQSLTWPDLLPEETFKMRINFGQEEEWRERSCSEILYCRRFRRQGALAEQGVKTGNMQVCAHAQTQPHKALVHQCTICNINVWKRV